MRMTRMFTMREYCGLASQTRRLAALIFGDSPQMTNTQHPCMTQSLPTPSQNPHLSAGAQFAERVRHGADVAGQLVDGVAVLRQRPVRHSARQLDDRAHRLLAHAAAHRLTTEGLPVRTGRTMWCQVRSGRVRSGLIGLCREWLKIVKGSSPRFTKFYRFERLVLDLSIAKMSNHHWMNSPKISAPSHL